MESYGVDFLTGNKNTRSDYEHIDPKGKAFLKPVHWRRQPNPVSEEYPFMLITGRVVYHSHTRTKTGRSDALNDRAPHAYVEIHPDDAARLEIGLGDRVEITSPHGRWKASRWWSIRCGPARCSCRSITDTTTSPPTSPGTHAIPSATSRSSINRQGRRYGRKNSLLAGNCAASV